MCQGFVHLFSLHSFRHHMWKFTRSLCNFLTRLLPLCPLIDRAHSFDIFSRFHPGFLCVSSTCLTSQTDGHIFIYVVHSSHYRCKNILRAPEKKGVYSLTVQYWIDFFVVPKFVHRMTCLHLCTHSCARARPPARTHTHTHTPICIQEGPCHVSCFKLLI